MKRSIIYPYAKYECCFIQAADYLLPITGQDIAAKARGKYSTYLGAMRFYKRLDIDAEMKALGYTQTGTAAKNDVVLDKAKGIWAIAENSTTKRCLYDVCTGIKSTDTIYTKTKE